MNTGDRIRIARMRAGLTQKELAQKVGVQFSAIHKYESGIIVNLKRETIAALADALDVKPSWLMCMDDDSTDDLEKKRIHDEINELFDSLSPEVRASYLTILREAARASKAQDAPSESD